MEQIDTRNREDPIPLNLERLLTIDQLHAITSFENFGWSLWFVRRKHMEPLVVMKYTDGSTIVVDEDGTMIKNHGYTFRES